MSEWKLLKVFSNLQEAYIAKSYLESEGVPVFLRDEMMTQVINVFGGAKLMVPEEDIEQAIELLEKGGFA